MELQHINVKLYLQDPQTVKLEALVPVFHEWIQNQVCEELLIDVADYRHVHAGPGVVLVGHEADYSVDNTDNRLGTLRESQRGTSRDRCRRSRGLAACRRLESDDKLGQGFRFNRRNFKLFVNDRMLASNAGRPSDLVAGEFRDFFATALGEGEFEMEFETDPRSLLGVEVKAAKPLELDSVLVRLT
jgi:hypothetical protein